MNSSRCRAKWYLRKINIRVKGWVYGMIIYIVWITSGVEFIFALLGCGSTGGSSERELYTSRMKEGPISAGERYVGGVVCDDTVKVR